MPHGDVLSDIQRSNKADDGKRTGRNKEDGSDKFFTLVIQMHT